VGRIGLLSDEIVTLTLAFSETEAAEICGYLGANGIEAMYDKGGVEGGLAWATPQVGGQEIVVRAEDEERARELLAELQQQ
jgi:hypothetical protein